MFSNESVKLTFQFLECNLLPQITWNYGQKLQVEGTHREVQADRQEIQDSLTFRPKEYNHMDEVHAHVQLLGTSFHYAIKMNVLIAPS